jgi:hypothetical protein
VVSCPSAMSPHSRPGLVCLSYGDDKCPMCSWPLSSDERTARRSSQKSSTICYQSVVSARKYPELSYSGLPGSGPWLVSSILRTRHPTHPITHQTPSHSRPLPEPAPCQSPLVPNDCKHLLLPLREATYQASISRQLLARLHSGVSGAQFITSEYRKCPITPLQHQHDACIVDGLSDLGL